MSLPEIREHMESVSPEPVPAGCFRRHACTLVTSIAVMGARGHNDFLAECWDNIMYGYVPAVRLLSGC